MVDGEFDNLTVNNILTIGADTNLYRGAADILKTDDTFDALSLKIDGATVINSSRQIACNDHVEITRGYRPYIDFIESTPATDVQTRVSPDAEHNNARLIIQKMDQSGLICFQIGDDGALYIGESAYGNQSDVNLYRSAPDVLKTDDSLSVGGSYLYLGGGSELVYDSGNDMLVVNVSDYAATRDILLKADKVFIGHNDVNLYRSAANVLKTDDNFVIGANLLLPTVGSTIRAGSAYIMGGSGSYAYANFAQNLYYSGG